MNDMFEKVLYCTCSVGFDHKVGWIRWSDKLFYCLLGLFQNSPRTRRFDSTVTNEWRGRCEPKVNKLGSKCLRSSRLFCIISDITTCPYKVDRSSTHQTHIQDTGYSKLWWKEEVKKQPDYVAVLVNLSIRCSWKTLLQLDTPFNLFLLVLHF